MRMMKMRTNMAMIRIMMMIRRRRRRKKKTKTTMVSLMMKSSGIAVGLGMRETAVGSILQLHPTTPLPLTRFACALFPPLAAVHCLFAVFFCVSLGDLNFLRQERLYQLQQRIEILKANTGAIQVSLLQSIRPSIPLHPAARARAVHSQVEAAHMKSSSALASAAAMAQQAQTNLQNIPLQQQQRQQQYSDSLASSSSTTTSQVLRRNQQNSSLATPVTPMLQSTQSTSTSRASSRPESSMSSLQVNMEVISNAPSALVLMFSVLILGFDRVWQVLESTARRSCRCVQS